MIRVGLYYSGLMKHLKLYFLLLISAILSDNSLVFAQKESKAFYSKDDFYRVKKFDTHIHINTEQNIFIQLAKADNFQFLDIVDDRPFGVPMDEQQRIAFVHLKNHPEQMKVATTFSVKGFNSPGWADLTIAGLKKSIREGAMAVKIWKNIGMDLRDQEGRFVMLDDPRLEPIFEFLVENKIPLIGHNGEPRDCWLPLDQMTFSKEYYGSHPEYHMFLHPEYPSYEQHIAARDNLLRKYPELRFTGAHLGSLEWSLDELAKRLDLYPNMRVDLSRITNLQLHALKDYIKIRSFFIKYQDRLIYGSDRAVNTSSDAEQLKKNIHDAWLRDWIFFTTEERITLPGFGELNGLHLPVSVIDKIYYKNAENWLGQPAGFKF